MAFPADYTRLGKLSTVASQVAITANGFVAQINADSFGDDASAVFANTDNGGGDVRFSTDSAGLNQIPCEMSSWDNNALTCHVLAPADLLNNLSTDIHIWGNNPGDVQPPATSQFGRNSVWVNRIYRTNDGGTTESSNGYIVLDDGSGSSVTGRVSGLTALQSPKKRLQDISVGDIVDNYTISHWQNGNQSGTFLSRRDGNTTQYQTGSSGGNYFHLDSNNILDLFGSIPSGWHKVDYVVNGNTLEVFVDGVSRGSQTIDKASQSSIPLRVGYRGNGGLGTVGFAYTGIIGEAEIYSNVKSQGFLTTEYNNQSDPAGFWSFELAEGGSTYEEAIILDTQSNITSIGRLMFDDSFSLNALSELINEKTLSINASLSFLSSSGINTQASASIETSIQLSSIAEINNQNISNIFSSVMLSNASDIISTLGNIISDSVTLESGSNLTANIGLLLSGNMTLGASSGFVSGGNVDFNPAVNIGAASSVSIVTQAIMQAGLSLDAISNMQMIGSMLVVGVTTPDKRTFTIEVSSRDFKIVTKDRIYKVND